MSDQAIEDRIEQLEAQERELRADEATRAATANEAALEQDAEKLKRIKVELDQQWDLLRQRRALRDAGKDPDTASLRDEGTVEGYLG
jgi:hypothetical protein